MANTKYTYNEKRKEWYTLVYDGTLTDTGAKHRKRISSKKSSADLEKKVIAFKREVEEGNTLKASTITFGEYAQEWLETSKSTKELNTIYMYKATLRTCFDTINDIPINKITHSDFQRCINLKKDHPRTCKNISMTFKQVIKSAIRDRYLPHSAVFEILEDINLPTYQPTQKRPLSEHEKTALFKADLDAKKRAFVSLLYYCGMRKGEVLALTPEDFDWKEKTVTVNKSWALNTIKPYPKSKNGFRTIPIPDKAIKSIKPYVKSCEGYLFHSKNSDIMTESSYSKMWNSIVYQMNQVADQPITDLTAHIFRHNYCTELCYQVPTISTKMIARLLGDRENMVIEVYSHLVEGKEDAVSVINSIFNL